MTGKVKSKKHTDQEIAAKVDVATTSRGGCKVRVADQTGHEKLAKFECPYCNITPPNVNPMHIHHDAKHPKIPFDEPKINTSTQPLVHELIEMLQHLHLSQFDSLNRERVY